MKNMPNIFKFLLLFLVLYVGLSIAPSIQPVRQFGVSIYNVLQQTTFNIFHPTARTDFRKFQGQSEENFDYSVYIFTKDVWETNPNKKKLRPSFILNQNARLTAFGPFIMLLALVLASPITWKRKIISLIVGGIFIYILLAMKYTAMIDANAVMLRPKGFSAWVGLSKLFNDAFRTQEFLALLILPIWAVTSFRSKDWKWFME